MSDHRDLINLYGLGHIEQHSPGMIHWHPNGAKVVRKLKHWLIGLHEAEGYQEVSSPMLLSRELWERSGHWEKYQDLMFVAQSEGEAAYAVKPMSCPGQIAIYASERRSYRQLPLRLFEFGHVHRKEASGALSGWLRLRGFVQDDSHVFCMPSQLQEVIAGFVRMVEKAYPIFGFEKWHWKLSLRPEKRAGSDAVWDKAEEALRQACAELGIEPEEVPGDGAFYGPKLEVVLEDRLGRKWQCGVAQVDFVLPERFGLEYQGAERVEQPVLVHHAVLGSLERWLAIALEHLGQLPDWLSPHQCALLPLSEQQAAHCHQLADQLRRGGVNAHVLEDGPLGGRVRLALEKKYAALAVVGPKEVAEGSVSVRQGKLSVSLGQAAWLKDLADQLAPPR